MGGKVIKFLIFNITFMVTILLSYYIGYVLWEEGISYTFPLFMAILGGAIFFALFFDGYIFKDLRDEL